DMPELRRQLRDAAARVYDQQRAIDALGAMAAIPSQKGARGGALAASLAAGLMLIGAGEAMQWRARDPDTVVVLPSRSQLPEATLEPAAPRRQADIVLADASDPSSPAPARKPAAQKD